MGQSSSTGMSIPSTVSYSNNTSMPFRMSPLPSNSDASSNSGQNAAWVAPQNPLIQAASISKRQHRPDVDWTTLQLDSMNDRLPDFSYAGAWNSNRELPSARRIASIKLKPMKDDTDRTGDIQAAVNKLGQQGGGIVELSKGTYYLSSQTSASRPVKFGLAPDIV